MMSNTRTAATGRKGCTFIFSTPLRRKRSSNTPNANEKVTRGNPASSDSQVQPTSTEPNRVDTANKVTPDTITIQLNTRLDNRRQVSAHAKLMTSSNASDQAGVFKG